MVKVKVKDGVGDGENDPEIIENMKLDLLDMEVVINNVCASFNLGLKTGVSLNLMNLVMRGVNMEYKTQNKITAGLRRPRCGAYIYTSGKISVFGNKTEEDAKFAARKLVKMIRNLAIKYPDICTLKFAKFECSQMKLRNFRIYTIWASTQLPWDIRLPMFATVNRECSYEPELSSSINYRINELKTSVKISYTGSLVIQTRKMCNINEAIRFLYPKAFPCKKDRKIQKMKEKEPKDKDKMWRANVFKKKNIAKK